MLLKRLAKLCLVTVIMLFFKQLTGLNNVTATDYQQELAEIESNIVRSMNTTSETDASAKKAYAYFLKSSLTGSMHDTRQAEAEFAKAVTKLPFSNDLSLLHATFNLKQHRFAAAQADLEKIDFLRADPKYQVLQADIALQQGNYTVAESLYRQAITQQKTWDNLVRLAYLHWKTGFYKSAEQLYIAAEDQISAKEMRAYAWVELQRGLMALNQGQHEAAWRHYQLADQAYSGYWLVKEYMAEWLGAQRRFDEAITLYRKLIICTPRPELYQALGDLYLFMGKTESARPWLDHALAAYMDSVRRGEVQYYHHLATFYTDTRIDGVNAVQWAQNDLQLRDNVIAHEALAWALYRNNQFPAALAEMRKALTGNWRDAHFYFHAGMIYLASGQMDTGKAYLKQAQAINPHYDSFHVHR